MSAIINNYHRGVFYRAGVSTPVETPPLKNGELQVVVIANEQIGGVKSMPPKFSYSFRYAAFDDRSTYGILRVINPCIVVRIVMIGARRAMINIIPLIILSECCTKKACMPHRICEKPHIKRASAAAYLPIFILMRGGKLKLAAASASDGAMSSPHKMFCRDVITKISCARRGKARHHAP